MSEITSTHLMETELSLYFATEPSEEVKAASEKSLRTLMGLISPESEIVVEKRVGSWWIVVYTKAAAGAAWFTLEAGSWVTNKVLDKAWAALPKEKIDTTSDPELCTTQESTTPMQRAVTGIPPIEVMKAALDIFGAAKISCRQVDLSTKKGFFVDVARQENQFSVTMTEVNAIDQLRDVL